MQRYFSPSTRGFYTDAVHGPRQIAQPQTPAEIKANKRPIMVDNPYTLIPADAVPVSDAQHAKLMNDQSEGKEIAARGGKAKAITRKADPAEREEQLRLERQQRLAASDWTQTVDTPLPAAAQQQWADYRQALRDHDFSSGAQLPSAPGFEEIV